MSFDRDWCLQAFESYRQETGSNELAGSEELAAMTDIELANYAAGVLLAVESNPPLGNGESSPPSPALSQLAADLQVALEGAADP